MGGLAGTSCHWQCDVSGAVRLPGAWLHPVQSDVRCAQRRRRLRVRRSAGRAFLQNKQTNNNKHQPTPPFSHTESIPSTLLHYNRPTRREYIYVVGTAGVFVAPDCSSTKIDHRLFAQRRAGSGQQLEGTLKKQCGIFPFLFLFFAGSRL